MEYWYKVVAPEKEVREGQSFDPEQDMTKVFIAGSRHVTRLDTEVMARIDRMMEQNFSILIGDANGADKAAQKHLHAKGHRNVQVFCVEGECRNNLGGWPVRSVRSSSVRKDFAHFASKDAVMANEATVGFMLWDGKSTGTLANVSRLIGQGKSVLVYLAPTRSFLELKNEADWQKLLSDCPAPVRNRFLTKVSGSKKRPPRPHPLSLFPQAPRWNPGTR
ncbi:MAG: hypothetical protein HYT87_11465 [Nitrospirae bacterium]|nr:hypothetical protein [Nitrospirota bacterium]